jgi:ribonuclease P protein component
MSEQVGPLVVYALPNELAHARLGLSVPRRVGGAAARNRIKRLLREVFRHHQSDFPRGYDFVVNVQAHTPRQRDEYEALLPAAMQRLHERWLKRNRRAENRRSSSANVERPKEGG